MEIGERESDANGIGFKVAVIVTVTDRSAVF